ncbi:phenylalanine 4-monooxygenase [Enterovibrio nigricans]|uniref:Phenylalanine-4-hydroxylase n=1 Tax=Enterovibrio nigricans DSM 22720 TaxID=1121868 RepID=A0A1T4UHN0_9GAMM|nr:phenylalanine 4-monooxygenase [Enterovibrio nigricans]PKF50416.1 phenylalanine 4-monooxygenase [Enterovibrio nigricans]SKA52302.1 Phenylalanine 4-hydroxylase [Enterovibrio nigricans DSM 22720]
MKAYRYESKPMDVKGKVNWNDEEAEVWHHLMTRQLSCIEGKACKEYLDGLEMLNLPIDQVPQIPDINRVLRDVTGWSLAPVPALIDFDRFFALLANRQFPVATFLRTRKDMDYLQEPDYFHEIFGHCAMLTDPAFAAFTELYGKLGVNASKVERIYLARLYWFTVEFGLTRSGEEFSIYGGGILSSPAETVYAYSDERAFREPLDIIEVMRTPYRIDILQPIYFYLEDMSDLYAFSKIDLMACVRKAMSLGLHKPLYPMKIAQ